MVGEQLVSITDEIIEAGQSVDLVAGHEPVEDEPLAKLVLSPDADEFVVVAARAVVVVAIFVAEPITKVPRCSFDLVVCCASGHLERDPYVLITGRRPRRDISEIEDEPCDDQGVTGLLAPRIELVKDGLLVAARGHGPPRGEVLVHLVKRSVDFESDQVFCLADD